MAQVVDKEEDYEKWRILMRHYLMAQDIWQVVESNEIVQGRNRKKWIRKNALALHAIKNSCGAKEFDRIKEMDSAKDAWDALVDMHNPLVVEEKIPEQISQTDTIPSAILPQDVNNNDDYQQQTDLPNPVVHACSTIHQEIQQENQVDLEIGTSVTEEHSTPKNLKDDNKSNKDGLESGQSTKTSSEIDLEKKDKEYYNDLSRAASQGKLYLAKYVVSKNKNLLCVRDRTGKIPVELACNGGNADVAHFLYCETPSQYMDPKKGGRGSYILRECVKNKLFDIAFDLLCKFPELAFDHQCDDDDNIVVMLAKSPNSPFSSKLGWLRQIIYNCMRVETSSIKPEGDDGKSCTSRIFKVLKDTRIFKVLKDTGREVRRMAISMLERVVLGCVYVFYRCSALLPENHCCPPMCRRKGIGCFICFVVPMQVALVSLIYMVFKIPIDCLRLLMFLFLKLPVILGQWLLNFLGIKQLYNLKLNHAYAKNFLQLICKQLGALNQNQLEQSRVVHATFQAIKNGIPEIAIEFLKARTSILWRSTYDPEDPSKHNMLEWAYDPEDPSKHNMLEWAVIYRQEKVVRRIYELDDEIFRNMLSRKKEGTNIIHLVAKLAPDAQLGRISGAALQLQSELKWFKSIEGVSPRSFNDAINKKGKTPLQMFVSEHKNLQKEAEEWVKKTAESATVVGALIITIMFAAAFTIPAGNSQDTGLPIFSHHMAFKVFIIMDSISLFAASSSVLLFLAILTSRYAWEDFLRSLPIKLILAISSLFISIATMMGTFCAALFIMLQGQLQMVIPITFLAAVPVTFFGLLQFPLYLEIYNSTFNPGIFEDKKVTFVGWLTECFKWYMKQYMEEIGGILCGLVCMDCLCIIGRDIYAQRAAQRAVQRAAHGPPGSVKT